MPDSTLGADSSGLAAARGGPGAPRASKIEGTEVYRGRIPAPLHRRLTETASKRFIGTDLIVTRALELFLDHLDEMGAL